MTEVDIPLSSIASTQDENIQPVDPPESPTKQLTARERFAARIAALAAKKPLRLSQAPPATQGEELILEPPEEKKVIDKATKWLAQKTHTKPVAVPLPTTSPKTPRSARKAKPLPKSEQIKQELAEKLRIRRQEEQQQRYAIYNADNEIDEEPEEDELSTDEEKEDDKDEEEETEAEKVPKKKFVVNEDEELVEVEDEEEEDPEKEESDADESEKEEDSDAEESKDEEKDTRPSRVFLSDDEDVADGDDNQDYMPAATKKPPRLIDSDDDGESDADEPPPLKPISPRENESESVKFSDKNAPTETQIPESDLTSMDFGTRDQHQDPNTPSWTQLLPRESSPLNTQERDIFQPMNILELDDGSDREELVNLCSGRFDTQTTQQTFNSKMDITEYLSDSHNTFLTPNPSTQFDSFEKQYVPDSLGFDDSISNLDNTADIVQRAYAEFENPDLDDDRIVPNGGDFESDSDDDIPAPSTSQPRKRRIVDYSDDEDSVAGQRTPMKQARLFDSDDEATDADTTIRSHKTPVKSAFSIEGMEDVFTTEEQSQSPIKQERVFFELSDSEEEAEVEEDEGAPIGRKTNKFLEDEASLSGDDVDEDDIDEDELGDEYEHEEADLEEMDEDEIRRRNAEHFRKKQDAEEERQLMRIKEKLFADSDLHGVGGNMDRSFRFRMREDMSDADWQALVKKNPALTDTPDSDEEEEDSEARQKAMDMKKWIMKKNQPVTDNIPSLLDDDLLDSPVLALGRQVLHKSSSTASSSTVVRTSYKTSNDSLLRNSSSLGVLLKDLSKKSSSSSSANRPGVFFSAVDKL